MFCNLDMEQIMSHIQSRRIINNAIAFHLVARGSVVVKALCCKPEGRGFKSQWGGFLNWPNPSGSIGPGVDSASNRNEYQESLKNKETRG
jgi:hypothetical protein